MSEVRSRNVHFRNSSCYLALCLLGIYLSVYQSVVHEIASDFHLSAGMTGLMISFHFFGSFLLPILLGEAGDRIGSRPVLIFSFLLLITGLLLAVLGHSASIFLLATFLIGGGFSVIEGMLTGLLTVANPERVNAVVNLSQMYFCLGAVGGPFVNLAVKAVHFGWRGSFLLLLILFTACFVWLARQQIPPYKAESIKGLYIKQLLKDHLFLFLLMGIFLYVGVEEGVAFWVGSYIENTLLTKVPSALFLSVYWLGMALGRWLFSFLQSRYKTWLTAGLVFSGFAVGFFLITAQPMISLLCLFLTGFGFAPAWPVLMMYASERGRNATHTAMGSMMAWGAAGGMVVPFFIGQLTEGYGLEKSMFLLLILLLVLILLLLPTAKQIESANQS